MTLDREQVEAIASISLVFESSAGTDYVYSDGEPVAYDVIEPFGPVLAASPSLATALLTAWDERDALIHDLVRLKDSETHELNRADALQAEVDRLRGVLEDALPCLQDNAYFLRNIQASAPVIMRATDAVEKARAALEPTT